MRKVASSRAESPPPTTAMVSPLKKKPSQVAHVDTPWPMQADLVVEAQHLGLAPVDTITDRAWYCDVAHLDQERA